MRRPGPFDGVSVREGNHPFPAVRTIRCKRRYSWPMKCAYDPSYQVALPPGHPFPMSKYSLLKDRLLAVGILAAADILQPEPIDAQCLELVHTREYLAKLASAGLS